MKLENSETVKYLFDHLKSIWTLSAGGLAFGIGLLGLISKDVRLPVCGYVICTIVISAGLLFYMYSIVKGLATQRYLIGEVFGSEIEEPTNEKASGIIDELIKRYERSRNTFIAGGIVLSVGTSIFIFWSVYMAGTSNPEFINISLKNAAVLTQDAQKIEIQDEELKVPNPGLVIQGSQAMELRDRTFKARVLEQRR